MDDKEQIFSEYLSQVFGGISAKGSILGMLFALWVRNFALQYYSLFILVSVTLYFLWKYKKVKLSIESKPPSEFSRINYLLLLIFPMYIVGGFLIRRILGRPIYSIIWEDAIFYFGYILLFLY